MPGTSLGTAYVQIVPSADGIKGSITDVLNDESEDAGNKSGTKIAAFAKKALKAAAIGKFVKDSLDEGGKLQQSYLGGLETLYSGAEDQIRSYARTAATAGISMNSFSEQAVSFGAALKRTFGDDVSGAADAANRAIMAMADNSAKMGTDIESIQTAYQGFAKDNYTMLDNLKLGYGGTRQEMQRLLQDAASMTKEQEELGIAVDANDMSFSNVANAIQVVQKNLGIAGVAADEAKGTLSGSFEAMKASYQNLIGSMAIGEDVTEALTNLTTSFSDWAFGNLIPMIGSIIASLPSVIITFISQGIPTLLTSLGGMVSSMADSIKTFADSVSAEKISTWVQTMLPKMLESADSILSTFISGLLRNLGKIVLAIGQIGLEIVKGLGSALWDRVTAAANGIKERFLQPINALKDRIAEIIGKIKDIIGNVKLKLPHIDLPHFKVYGGKAPWGIGGKGSPPSFDIDWYAKGGIFDSPSLIGVGEAGREIVTPDKLLRQIVNEGNADTASILGQILDVLEYIAASDKSIVLNKREFGRLVNEASYG